MFWNDNTPANAQEHLIQQFFPDSHASPLLSFLLLSPSSSGAVVGNRRLNSSIYHLSWPSSTFRVHFGFFHTQLRTASSVPRSSPMPPKRISSGSPSGTPAKLPKTETRPEDFSNSVKKRLQSSTRTGQACDRCKVCRELSYPSRLSP